MKYNLSQQEYQDSCNIFRNKILSSSKIKSSEFQKFASIFFEYIPIDYLDPENIESFSNFANEAFEVFISRDARVRNVIITRHEKEEHYTSIILLGTDMPFIIDSIKSLFSRLNLEINFLFHPILDSKIDSLENLNINKCESLVYITVSGILDDYIIEKIKVSLLAALESIGISSNAEVGILQKIQEITDNLKICPIGYECQEIFEYVNWLKSENFSFVSWLQFEGSHDTILIKQKLGADKFETEEYSAVKEIAKFAFKETNKDIAIFGKLNYLSPIHQGSYMDYILIKDINKNGLVVGAHIFLGVYSESIHYKSIKEIPILRQKLEYVLSKSFFKETGYNYKKLISIIESLPREFLFRVSAPELYIYSMSVLSSLITSKLSLIVNNNFSEGFLNFLIFLPANRLTPEAHESVSQYLSIRMNRALVTSYYDFIGTDFGYIYLMFEDGKDIEQSTQDLEAEINLMTSSWCNSLRSELIRRNGRKNGIRAYKNYAHIFSKEYKDKFFANDAIEDLEIIFQATSSKRVVFNLINRENSQILKIYYPNKKLSLSEIMPFIENLGFQAIDEQTFYIASSKDSSELWVHSFNLKHPHISLNNFGSKKANIENALDRMHAGELANDSLCKLVILADMSWWEINILRAITRYLHQTGFIYGKGYVQLVLVEHHDYSSQIIDLFETKFNPELSSKDQAQKIRKSLGKYLASIKSSAEDKVLRSVLGIVEAMTRTNFYKRDFDNQFKKYISFKFDSHKVPNLPIPLPYAEIYVYSREFEGIHLRGGKVARGGLRWSDRGEDYRTEALGLMKAQMTKNAVIVPVGSKGAFFVKIPSTNLTKTEYQEQVVECYKNFLRGMLDLTDNIIEQKTITPEQVVAFDSGDPYLVVAADKGTATFSDYANQVSAEYDFWLGDAFASGGSAGYDHKKMAITARGGWIAVVRHFKEKGLDIAVDPITVAGIGDMSGDVFGNGMLMSKAIKLVAAFNHMHIFIDPTPNAETSYSERERLFNLPGSSWDNYDKKLISDGGGIFERSSKSIKLSEQITNLLNLVNNEVSPEELIIAILKADVDLLWNGGIGTYIKASSENNIDIGDKTNDNVRVSANEVRVKVIGEGGNLGISQLGRIEFARNGGRINTDFIDNSAGVDCSDHEVNIKIALFNAEKSGKLSREDRDKLLVEMTEEVAELVLADNRRQTLAISLMEKSTAFQTEAFGKLLEELEKQVNLKRKVEFLPSTVEIAKISASGERLTRPELAVILSYSKMLIYQSLENSKLGNEPFMEKILLEYFPVTLQKRFKSEIFAHPLKNEIILTSLTNEIVNRMSGVVIHSISTETGAKICDIVRSYTVISEIFDMDHAWEEIDKLNISDAVRVELYTEINKLLRRGVSWFLRNFDNPIKITELIKKYKNTALLVSSNIETFLIGEAKERFKIKLKEYLDAGVPNDISKLLAKLDVLVSALDITLLSEKAKLDQFKIAKSYFEIGDCFYFDYLRKWSDKLLTNAYWNRLAIQSLKDDLYNNQCKLAFKLQNEENIYAWLSENSEKMRIYTEFISHLKSREDVNLNMIILAIKKFELCLQVL